MTEPMSDSRARDVVVDWAALQGVALAPERAAGAASVISSQLAVERAATAKLPFEAEPANYTVVLHRGAAT